MSDYIVHDTSLTAVADAIRTQTGRSGALEFPTQFASEINSLALKRGVLRHDAELIHTVSYDRMLVEDEGVEIPAYTTAETQLITVQSLSPNIPIDLDLYDYTVITRTLTIPIYNNQAQIGAYWHDYYSVVAIVEIVYTPPRTFTGIISGESVDTPTLSANTKTSARRIRRNKNNTDWEATTSTTYGIRQSTSNVIVGSARNNLTLRTPTVAIRGASSDFPQACWEALEDVRLQYVMDVYRSPKNNLNLDGWGLSQEMNFIADCVNSADHKLR